ncbi:hypothetical protein, partial [Aeromicrobium sp.]|uniref:glycosyltransferase n=1 Tax=Aeromicrobium sp. TaxID=1871063 RepID=UPI0019B78617
EALVNAEADRNTAREIGVQLREQAEKNFDWDVVTHGYADLARDLINGQSSRGQASGRRHH